MVRQSLLVKQAALIDGTSLTLIRLDAECLEAKLLEDKKLFLIQLEISSSLKTCVKTACYECWVEVIQNHPPMPTILHLLSPGYPQLIPYALQTFHWRD